MQMDAAKNQKIRMTYDNCVTYAIW